MNILALDYGTKTGFCYGSIKNIAPHTAGTWELATKKEITAWGKQRLNRRHDPRITRLAKKLNESFILTDYVVFEDVEFASSTYQVQLWASLRTVGWLSIPKVKFECVPVGTLKLFATGNGHAKKIDMKRAFEGLPTRPSLPDGLDDNGIDAVHIWYWAKRTLARA